MLENLENGRKIWTNRGKSKNQDDAKKNTEIWEMLENL